jgi:hypothetical protein
VQPRNSQRVDANRLRDEFFPSRREPEFGDQQIRLDIGFRNAREKQSAHDHQGTGKRSGRPPGAAAGCCGIANFDEPGETVQSVHPIGRDVLAASCFRRQRARLPFQVFPRLVL